MLSCIFPGNQTWKQLLLSNLHVQIDRVSTHLPFIVNSDRKSGTFLTTLGISVQHELEPNRVSPSWPSPIVYQDLFRSKSQSLWVHWACRSMNTTNGSPSGISRKSHKSSLVHFLHVVLLSLAFLPCILISMSKGALTERPPDLSFILTRPMFPFLLRDAVSSYHPNKSVKSHRPLN